MSKCIIFGALPIKTTKFSINADDLVIAADGGYDTLKSLNIEPDVIIGDFDSIKSVLPSNIEIIKHPVKKNYTDTLLAIKYGLEKGYSNFIIYGCLGGRLDHTFANIQAASFTAEKNANAVFIDQNTYLTVIKNNSISFSKENRGNISVFAVSGNTKGVSINNLLYDVSNIELTPDFPLGISNEFIKKDANISVVDGKLCVIWNGTDGQYKIERN
jgi:thiamine pyrophosphokinase